MSANARKGSGLRDRVNGIALRFSKGVSAQLPPNRPPREGEAEEGEEGFDVVLRSWRGGRRWWRIPRSRPHRPPPAATLPGSAARSRPRRRPPRRTRRFGCTPPCAAPITRSGGVSSTRGSLAVFLPSHSRPDSRPCAITPPTKTPSAVMQSKVGGGPEIDGDGVPSVHLLGRECVHDTIGADRERLLDVQPNRQRASSVHHDGCLSHDLLERIRENSGRGGHDRTQDSHRQVVVGNPAVAQQRPQQKSVFIGRAGNRRAQPPVGTQIERFRDPRCRARSRCFPHR